MNERKELSEVQRFALQAAREKFLEAQNLLNEIVREICQEHEIPEADISNWQFTQNFKYLEKIKAVIIESAKRGGKNEAV